MPLVGADSVRPACLSALAVRHLIKLNGGASSHRLPDWTKCRLFGYFLMVMYRAPATGFRSRGILHRQPAVNNKLAPKPTPEPNPTPNP